MGGFHAYDEENGFDVEEIDATNKDDGFYDEEIDAKTAQLTALDQQRMIELFGDEDLVPCSIEQYFDSIESDADPLDDESVLLITSNIDYDLDCKIQQESDFQIVQHQN